MMKSSDLRTTDEPGDWRSDPEFLTGVLQEAMEEAVREALAGRHRARDDLVDFDSVLPDLQRQAAREHPDGGLGGMIGAVASARLVAHPRADVEDLPAAPFDHPRQRRLGAEVRPSQVHRDRPQ